ncbi:exodeoxyribonuclease VII large subunit [Hydrogenimonas cancrithermarum]|uniref:Exodeoxyribonuclease 7 large subunit n=1 Tax=Hydrogenimonas cancrithermarum TaxID=2993563 RepID=A0ABM8FJQ7_9BACT|nr:exodeoxyribonuclease VII large subunit [Hydrogenimonas cancrithermarum]BDY12541.1 exodeoxyribonuclease 7 large subunit [Hydrogenimonas cancrithermarum]
MTHPITVSRLNEQIKSLLESTFIQIRVEGEISQVTYHTSGHIYFTIKDDRSALSCVMFRSNARNLRFRLEAGQHVVLGGAITVYVPRGNYQMMVQTAEPYGAGALSVAYEQLKKRLADEGLFSSERKKAIPRTIRHIVVVTSKTGAAIQDMIRVASKRWPLVKITLVDTLVQGAEAAQEIASHIAYADTLGADVIIVGRGGGSLEDLWAFNEEAVARAIAACKTPVVSAVGHEVDTLISDFVADMRAPTPSAAMEQILPDKIEMLYALDEMMERMERRMHQILLLKTQSLQSAQRQLEQHAISKKITIQLQDIRQLAVQMHRQMRRVLQQKEESLRPLGIQLEYAKTQLFQKKGQQLQSLEAQLISLDPRHKLRPGFVQLVKDSRVTTLESIREGDRVRLEDGKFVAEARIESIRSNES